MKLDNFYKFIYSKQPDAIGKIQQVCNTYSFYMWSIADCSVTHLTLKSKDAPYRDSVAAYMSGNVPELKVEKTTLVDNLSRFGFNMPDEDSIKNLQTVLVKKPDNEGFLSRFFVKSKSPMHKRGF
jgi:hypothetical protein